MRLSTEEPEEQEKIKEPTKKSAISKYLSEIGRRGGLIGGKARFAKLSARKRKDIAKKAADARWHKNKKS